MGVYVTSNVNPSTQNPPVQYAIAVYANGLTGEMIPTPVTIDPVTGQFSGGIFPAAGDVDGPSSATNNALVRFDGTTGKLIKDSPNIILDNSGNLSGIGLLVANAIASVAGSITSSTTLTATLGAITATNGNFVFGTAGNKVIRPVATTITAGANSAGSVTLVGGTATISTTAVTTNSLIKIWRQSIGATGAAAVGELAIGTITNGASFVINAVQAADATALQATDVSVIGWEIVN